MSLIEAEYRFDRPGSEWTCTVLFEEGKPSEILFSVWKVNEPWEEQMASDLSEALGVRVRVTECSAGNGHGSAKLVIL